MVVLVLIIVMTAASVYGVRSIDNEVRASASTRKIEMAMYAAEAGASERLAEISLATSDAGAALDSAFETDNSTTLNVQTGGWRFWPLTGTFADPNIDRFAQFQTDSAPVVAVEARPPPGVQIGAGGQVTVWRVDGYALTGSHNAANALIPGFSYSQQVQVGVSLWSRGGMSYNN
ncbi:MAG: hypothetical protein U1E65_32085 [Myxococcota bacterium]